MNETSDRDREGRRERPAGGHNEAETKRYTTDPGGIRSVAAPSAGRGAGGPASGTASGVAILSAAAKRTREDGEVATENSLAKRLKPAVAAAAATTALTADGNANAGGVAGGKPITLQRNRVQPS